MSGLVCPVLAPCLRVGTFFGLSFCFPFDLHAQWSQSPRHELKTAYWWRGCLGAAPWSISYTSSEKRVRKHRP